MVAVRNPRLFASPTSSPTVTPRSPDSTPALAPVSIHEVYPLEVFKQKTGLADWAFRQAIRNGLCVVQVGRRRYVRGRDFADYLGRLRGAEAQTDLVSVGQV